MKMGRNAELNFHSLSLRKENLEVKEQKTVEELAKSDLLYYKLFNDKIRFTQDLLFEIQIKDHITLKKKMKKGNKEKFALGRL